MAKLQERKISHMMVRRAFLLSSFVVLYLILAGALFQPVRAAENPTPLAVYRSKLNEATYQDQHLGTFTKDYDEFKRNLSSSNVRFDELDDNQVAEGKSRLSKYKLVVVPMLVDLPADSASGLKEYFLGGGKILVTDGGGQQQPGARALVDLMGVSVDSQRTFKSPTKLAWVDTPLPIEADFAVGSQVAVLKLGADTRAIARWKDESGAGQPAIARRGNGAYLTWIPGLQGDLTTNARFLAMTLDELAPGITQEAVVQISFAEYQSIKSELDYLNKRTEEAIKTAAQAEFAVPINEIKANYQEALGNVESFHSAYKERRFQIADEHLNKARHLFALAFAQSMPVRAIEARSIWLDRGTIVATKNPQGMVDLFSRLKKAGINVVYFETNNAGFTMYPSKLTEQNPETKGWSPLAVAVQEARKHGMEIHAWLWIFNVGNMRHNPIIGKAADYPGPVLNRYDFNWAMASKTGSLVPPNQSEFWIDPSNTDCRRYVKSLIREVTSNFDVDGIQLDYIRYPFNNIGSEMGFNWHSRVKFEQQTGLSLDDLNEETRALFVAWKTQQVNEMVKEVSDMIRAEKPKCRISAAVYAFPRRMRVNAVQQEWETWVANGWIDTLNPMTYADSPKKLAIMADFCRESTSDKALVFPGLAIMRVDTAGLIEQLDTARATGTLGTTIFAMAHLDDKKLNVLAVGPYRKKTLLTPQSDPIRASRFLVDDFAAMVNRYLHDPDTHILSDTASTNDVIAQIETLQETMHELSDKADSEKLESIKGDVTHLHNTVKEWLRLEAFIQRGFRAQYIVDYLGQVEAILSYASHRAKVSQLHGGRGNMQAMAE
ncbi:MAG: family 10 glycosylhydrolase [Candidatus Obscuribacterales bacterium]|nr:family 10 glycosylhydrolase [Candidatus Obscuribacterales bacterium]